MNLITFLKEKVFFYFITSNYKDEIDEDSKVEEVNVHLKNLNIVIILKHVVVGIMRRMKDD